MTVKVKAWGNKKLRERYCEVGEGGGGGGGWTAFVFKNHQNTPTGALRSSKQDIARWIIFEMASTGFLLLIICTRPAHEKYMHKFS